MTLSTQQMRACLQAFDFKRLFVEELGWNNYATRVAPTEIDGVTYSFAPTAVQGGMVVVTCTASDGNIPPSGVRRKIDKHISGFHFEHLIIFLDKDAQGAAQTSLWWWVKREDGKTKPRTFTYRRGSMGDALLQKLAGIAFAIEDLDDEGQVSIATVTSKVKKAFDVETVTKKFYVQFQTEHTAFLKFLTGLPDGAPRDWYASVMLNRLMFLYFIQKKRFLNDDPDYLLNKLDVMRGAGKNFYRDFLLILFFEGLANEESERDTATNALLGKIPYLNGGLFLPHMLEEQYGGQITVADEAFERLFKFFEDYTWHLDDRPLRKGNEINPDVLGYIFEKYINQKQMGAYYTKEDITGYICRSTIVPFLLDKCGVNVRDMMTDVEPYIYEAVTTEDYLPTETEREYAARRKRYEQIKTDFADGKIVAIDDLVTYNLDIQALVEDWLRTLDDPVALRRFYFECLTKLTVLDPTCGSGAFLFAAINILEPLYELALDKMLQVVGVPKDAPITPNPRENVVKYLDFVDELKRVSAHPNRPYYVLKRIIVDNLYGVDIMDEAVEICKLRLFLKMVAQVDDPARVEPLPDIDFNIRAGNTLVGFATRGEIEGRLFATPELKRKVADADRALRNFRDLQTRIGVEASAFKSAKADIQKQMEAIRADLDQSLMDDYGLTDLPAFRGSHKPFHWYVEFNSVLANGGFDVIVGNPPYAELRSITSYTPRNFKTLKTKNLYPLVMERCFPLSRKAGRLGLIVPVSSISTEGYKSLQEIVFRYPAHFSSFDDRPSKLFEGLEHIQLTIHLIQNLDTPKPIHFVTECLRWSSGERETLFSRLQYQEVERVYIQYTIPKISRDVETSILNKIWADSRTIGNQQTAKGKHIVYFSRKVHNFLQALDFVPEVYDGRGNLRPPSELKQITWDRADDAAIVFGVLNSTLFRWFINIFSDCRHVNKREVEGFKIDLPRARTTENVNWIDLAMRLSDSLKQTSEFRQMRFSHDTLRVQCIIPKFSKPIIDEIDWVLARHYGFTDEELDFIINYDIKYRLGRDAESGDEGEE